MLRSTAVTKERFSSSTQTVPSSQLVLEQLVHELKAAYNCMPDLSLTALRASRLIDVDVDVAAALLGVLVAKGVIRRNADGTFSQSYRH